MKLINIFFLIFLSSSLAQSATSFHLTWDYAGLPFEVRTVQAPLTLKGRVGETGTYIEKDNLPILKNLSNGEISLNRAESGYLYLFIKNTSKRKIKFSVAPHSTHPGASALGFSFNCLCNGHVYTAEPNQIWYRIMELKNNSTNSEKIVELNHVIFEIRK